MKEFIRPEAVIISYPIRSLGDPDDFLFFDIETTGLTPENAQVYLIGALSHSAETGWTLHQWFADSLSSEEEMLRAFFSFASSCRILVHYNGDSFDIPFLMRCAAQYGIPHPFAGMSSLDLYRAIRPYRKILGTERINQKSMEQFLGLDRADKFSGGELISVYQNYLSSGGTALLQQLLLHNEEDVTGLPVLLSLMAYRDFFLGDFSSPSTVRDENEGYFEILLDSGAMMPVPVKYSGEGYMLAAEDHSLRIRFPLLQGTLHFFYDNYKDYYYLPLEDRAVHCSVGNFVDRSARVKATARTAYVKKEGWFVRRIGRPESGEKIFLPAYRSPERYLDADDPVLEDPGFLVQLALDCLKTAGLREE